jgi:membrane protein implicated in regulation of membrane protease activity
LRSTDYSLSTWANLIAFIAALIAASLSLALVFQNNLWTIFGALNIMAASLAYRQYRKMQKADELETEQIKKKFFPASV